MLYYRRQIASKHCGKRSPVSYIFDDMGVLRNYRHELFAEAIANGYSAVKAHEIAGFLPDRGNAWRLQRRHDIRQRIDQLVAGRQRAVDAAVASAAQRVGIDQEWVLRNLKLNALMSMRAGDRSAAARSLELLGKHLGLFIDVKGKRRYRLSRVPFE